MAKYFDFEIARDKKKTTKINGFTVTLGDPSIKPEDLSDIFGGRNIDAKKLREKAWPSIV